MAALYRTGMMVHEVMKFQMKTRPSKEATLTSVCLIVSATSSEAIPSIINPVSPIQTPPFVHSLIPKISRCSTMHLLAYQLLRIEILSWNSYFILSPRCKAVQNLPRAHLQQFLWSKVNSCDCELICSQLLHCSS